jgi:hypothetical protein
LLACGLGWARTIWRAVICLSQSASAQWAMTVLNYLLDFLAG